MSDDIAHIEGQNRGLQVQTSNQRSLLSELDNLMVRTHLILFTFQRSTAQLTCLSDLLVLTGNHPY